LEQAAQASDGVITPGVVKRMSRCGSLGGGVGMMVGLDDLRGLFQPMIL